ncbi:MAG: hypothetical protein ABSF09_13900 [Candidatus Bathyarchaeia archaeon]
MRRLGGYRVERLLGGVLTVSLLGGVAALSIGEVFNSATLLMLSSAEVVLSTLFLSATKTSEIITKILQRH